jgi:hypothetical protein
MAFMKVMSVADARENAGAGLYNKYHQAPCGRTLLIRSFNTLKTSGYYTYHLS